MAIDFLWPYIVEYYIDQRNDNFYFFHEERTKKDHFISCISKRIRPIAIKTHGKLFLFPMILKYIS